MTIEESHYQFKLNKDRIDSLSTKDFNDAEIDWLLNEAQLVFVKQRTGQNNSKRRGFESIQKRIDDLSTLVIKFPLQQPLVPTEDSGVYEMDLNLLDFSYYQLVSLKGDITLPNNCVKLNVPFKFVQHDDYLTIFRDPFNSPSEEFIPYNFGRSSSGSNSSVYIYPGNIVVDKVYPEYIKLPSKVSLGTYVYSDGITYPPTTFELPEHTHQEIIDLACQLAVLNAENPELLQLKNFKVSIHE